MHGRKKNAWFSIIRIDLSSIHSTITACDIYNGLHLYVYYDMYICIGVFIYLFLNGILVYLLIGLTLMVVLRNDKVWF